MRVGLAFADSRDQRPALVRHSSIHSRKPRPFIIRPGRVFSPSVTGSTHLSSQPSTVGESWLAPRLSMSPAAGGVAVGYLCPSRTTVRHFSRATSRATSSTRWTHYACEKASRAWKSGDRLAASGTHAETVAYRHVLPLDPDVDRLFATFQKSRVQRGIRQADRFVAGGLLAVKRVGCEADLTEAFYRLHLSTRRRLGVPVQPRRFFRLLWERLLEPGLGFALLAQSEGRSVAGAVFLHHGRTMVYKYGASERDAQRLRPNHLLMWSAIREACEHGLEVFDFGRTDLNGDSLREFKLGWGTAEEPLVYSYLGRRGRAPRITAARRPRSRR